MKSLKNSNKIWCIIFVILFIPLVIALNKVQKHYTDKNEDELQGNISFVSNRTDKSDELNKLIEEFGKIHPNVTVKLELIGDAEEILERKASLGDMADVTLVPSVIQGKEFYKYFLPIDDLGITKEKVYDYSSGVGTDGKLYTLTTSESWHGVIYNKDIFKELGITRLPTNQAEFLDVCNKIKSNGIVPVALNYKQSWIMGMWGDIIPYLYNINFEKGVLLNNEDILGNDSAIYKALNLARNIYSNGYCEEDPLNYEWRQCKEDILDGKIAMIIWNSDFIYQLEDLGMGRDSIGMFPLPDTNVINMTGDYKIAINKNTKYPEAAKEFLKYLFEEDRYVKAVNIMSNSKESERTKEVLNNLNEFNLPVKFQSDKLLNETDEDRKIYNKYYTLKNSVGLNYCFIQSYITSENPEKLREDMNSEWREQRDN